MSLERVAPTLAKRSSIARASACPVCALSSPMPRPCFILVSLNFSGRGSVREARVAAMDMVARPLGALRFIRLR